AEIDAARDSERTIHHHDLAMVALVDAGETLIERVQRIECTQRNTGGPKSVQKLHVGVEGPYGVVQRVDLHAARRSRVQQRAQCLIVSGGYFEYETLHQDILTPFGNCCKLAGL